MTVHDALPRLDSLFSPLRIGRLMLRNRVVMSPMTRQFASDGILDDAVDGYYARRAAGGTGLIVTEGTAVGHDVSHYTSRVPNFYGTAALARWSSVVALVHAQGGAIFPQLWHAGLARRRSHTGNPDRPSISASAMTEEALAAAAATIPAKSAQVRRPAAAMTTADIDAVIEAFAAGAADAQAIGCDGVAIHGAHGYLLDQFLWDRSNRRDDRYGGSLENRIRFSVELVRAVRLRVGPDFPIMLRFSQWKAQDYEARLAETPDILARILVPLAEAGVDIFDASTRRFWRPEFDGSPLNLAGWAKRLTGKLSMTVGSVGLEDPLELGTATAGSSRTTTRNFHALAEMLDRGDFDLVGVGRGLIANADWADLVRRGQFDALLPYDARSIAATLEPAR